MNLKSVAIALELTASLSAQAQHVMDVNTKKLGAPVQSTMYGLFFEDINFAADGGLYGELIKKLGTFYGDLHDLIFVLMENLFALGNRSRVVEMDDGSWRSLYSFKSLLDDMFSCLCENLNSNIIRNHVLLDQCPDKPVFCIR